MPQAPAPPACSASHSLATALTGVLPVSLKSVPRLVHKIEVASDPLLALIGRAEADSARAIVLTLAGLTSARIAEAFGVREDTVRLRRSDCHREEAQARTPRSLRHRSICAPSGPCASSTSISAMAPPSAPSPAALSAPERVNDFETVQHPTSLSTGQAALQRPGTHRYRA
jgi:hypothetical protein